MDIGRLMTLQGTLFLLTATGILLARFKILPPQAKGILTDLVIYVTLPCNLAYAFKVEINTELLTNMLSAFFMAWLIQAISWAASKLIYRRYPDGRRQVFQYAAVCSNGGFLGNPVAESVYGSLGLLYASFFLIPQRIFMWSAGLSLFTKVQDKRMLLKKVATHPCIIAVYAGLLIMLFRPRFPAFIDDTVTSLGRCTTPLSMLMIGMILADIKDVRQLFTRDVFCYCFLRLAVLPGIGFLACRLLCLDPVVTGIVTLLTAMPAASMTTVLAAKYGGDTLAASKCVVCSTGLALVSLPLWCIALGA